MQRIRREGMKKTRFSVVFSMKNDETASVFLIMLPLAPHYLEAWGDYEFKFGYFALVQPTIRPLFDTLNNFKMLFEMDGSESTYHDYLKSYWTEMF